MRSEELTELQQALGYPGPGVEQLAGLQEGRQRGEHGGQDLGHLVAGREVGELHRRVAEEVQLVGGGQADPHRGQVDVRTPRCPAPRVTLVHPDDHVEHPAQIGDGGRHQADAVQGAAGGHQAHGADQPAGRLVAEDAVEGGGDPARAGGVGGHGERHLAGGDREGGARARAAEIRSPPYTLRGTVYGVGCRSGRWRTGPGWSCRPGSRPRRAAARPPGAVLGLVACAGQPPAWSASRRCRCCP